MIFWLNPFQGNPELKTFGPKFYWSFSKENDNKYFFGTDSEKPKRENILTCSFILVVIAIRFGSNGGGDYWNTIQILHPTSLPKDMR